MSSDSAYLDILKSAVQMKQQCSALHLDSIPLTLENGGETVWGGIVEVFALIDNKNATRCYAWTETVNECEQRFIIIPQKGLVITPAHAVKAWLATRSIVIHPVVPGTSIRQNLFSPPLADRNLNKRPDAPAETLSSSPKNSSGQKVTVFP